MKNKIIIILVTITLLLIIPFEADPVKADSTSDFSWRNWVDVDVIYLGSDSITLKLTFKILGYTLHNNTDVVVSTIKSREGWTVKSNTVAIKAWFTESWF